MVTVVIGSMGAGCTGVEQVGSLRSMQPQPQHGLSQYFLVLNIILVLVLR